MQPSRGIGLLCLIGCGYGCNEEDADDRDCADWNPGPRSPAAESLLPDRCLHQIPREDGDAEGNGETHRKQAVAMKASPSLVEHKEYRPVP